MPPRTIKITYEKGFTLLELLTVVAVISILAVICLPIYFDYATRAQVTEGISLMGEFKTRVTETYYANGSYPATNAQAGMGEPEDYATEKISSISIGEDGVITVEYSLSSLGSNNLLAFEPFDTGNGIDWSCIVPEANGIEDSYVPSECRSTE